MGSYTFFTGTEPDQNEQRVEIVSSERHIYPGVILPRQRSLLLITSVSKSSHQAGEDAERERCCPCFDQFRQGCALLPTDRLSGSNPGYSVVFPSEKFDPFPPDWPIYWCRISVTVFGGRSRVSLPFFPFRFYIGVSVNIANSFLVSSVRQMFG